MKKRWIIVSGAVVLCAALALALVFMPTKQEAEVPQVESLTVSTTISLDFSEQTDGNWEFYEDLTSRESPAWPDQIYKDEHVINDELPKLVPSARNTVLSGGWSEDRTVYVSTDGTVQLFVTGLAAGNVYRTALFVPREDGSVGSWYASVIRGETEERTPVVSADFSCVPGVYEDLTLVITGNGEQYAHTFNVQVQNVSDDLAKARDEGQPGGLYFDTAHWGQVAWLRSGGAGAEETVRKAKSGVSIAAPSKKDVYTGYDGAELLPVTVALDQTYSTHDRFEIAFVLTDPSGQTAAEGTCDATAEDHGEFSCLSARIPVPQTLEEGQYSLSAEVFRTAGEKGTAQALGEDTVKFSLRKEYNLSELYGQFGGQVSAGAQGSNMRFDLNCGGNILSNGDSSHVTIHDKTLTVGLAGMVPGVLYRCALIGETEKGDSLKLAFSLQTGGEATFSSTSLDIFSRSDTYSDLTLLAYDGQTLISHVFTCEVILPAELEQEATIHYNWLDSFRRVGEAAEQKEEPETGFAVNIPENSVFTGYEGCSLGARYTFAPEYSGKQTIEVSLIEESSGRVINYMEYNFTLREDRSYYTAVVVGEGFESGAFILRTTFDGHQLDRRIFLEKEKSPMEIYEGLETDTSYRVLGVADYKKAASGMISGIKAYLDSMDSFDTDMYNAYLRYRYAPDQKMINSFALLSPNVPESEMTIDQEDLLFTINWLIRDTYTFQLKDIKHYTDAKLIDLDALYGFFGDDWKELKALDYAAGMGTDTDGTVYLWLPVYYENEQGGFVDDQLYLFVYVLHQGPDTAYLEGIEYYNPDAYNDYHTTQLLITDQAAVARLLTALCRRSTALYQAQEPEEYAPLELGSRGDAVWLLQRRLQRMGYLTTSVDAVFTHSVESAVAAWQADMGMEESNVVTVEMQEILHDITVPRQLLMTWLNSHR